MPICKEKYDIFQIHWLRLKFQGYQALTIIKKIRLNKLNYPIDIKVQLLNFAYWLNLSADVNTI